MKHFISALIVGAFVLTSSNFAFANCGVHLQAGKFYSNRHVNTRGWSFDGRLKVTHTYACAEGTCYTGSISFPAFNNGISELVTGHWSGASFKMRRFVDLYSYVQTWTGTCGVSGINGNWVIDPEPANKGTFSISY